MNRQYHPDGDLPVDDEIFVFGSNVQGFHGLGAAKLAAQQYGAVERVGHGLQGQSYAVATRYWDFSSRRMMTLSLDVIKNHVDKFVKFTKDNPHLKFWVSGVGCGYAGYRASDIAPMFKEAINCSFPHTWEQSLYVTDLKDQVRK